MCRKKQSSGLTLLRTMDEQTSPTRHFVQKRKENLENTTKTKVIFINVILTHDILDSSTCSTQCFRLLHINVMRNIYFRLYLY